jgi:hypothetical protein
MAVTTVASLNIYLGETDTTTAKTNAVSATCSFIETYCERVFDSTERFEWQFAKGNQIRVDYRPIISVARLMEGESDAISMTWTGAGTHAHVNVTNGKLTVVPSTGESLAAASLTLASYASMALLHDAIESTLGWGATVITEGDPRSIRPLALADGLNATVTLQQPDQVLEAESIDEDEGIITLTGGGAGWVYIHYTSGYAAIPAALTQLANEMAATVLHSSAINMAVQSERIGDYQYSTGSSSATTTGGDTGIFVPFMSRLNLFRKRSL